MSARKTTSTKLPEETVEDFGFFSGSIDDSCEIKIGELISGVSDAKVMVSSELDVGISSGCSALSTGYSGASSGSHHMLGDIKCETDVSESAPKFDSGYVDVLSSELSSVKLEVHPPPLSDDTSLSNQLPPLDVLFRQDDEGDSQLHIAAIHACTKAMSLLIKLCPNPEWLSIPNDQGLTPLHLAVLSGDPTVTKMLVIAGAQLGLRDRMGETPLHKATLLKNVDCINALLGEAHPRRKIYQSVLDQKNYNGQACVHLAAAAGDVNTLKRLVFYGANIDNTENLSGRTALHMAVARGDLPTAEYLRRLPGVELRARDFAGRTPRRLARRAPHLASLLPDDSDSDSDSDQEMYDSEEEELFERFQRGGMAALVA